ncbi:MAG: hypothetical protein ACRELA_03455 [Candidatus Rokuibacteriota bacterium]
MKRLVAGLLVLGLVAMIVATPTPALAHRHGHRHHGHPGYVVGGFAAAAVTGLILGGLFAPRVYYAPPLAVYQPAPVYGGPAPVYPGPVYAPTPVCADYWVDTHWSEWGWVPGHYQRVCR